MACWICRHMPTSWPARSNRGSSCVCACVADRDPLSHRHPGRLFGSPRWTKSVALRLPWCKIRLYGQWNCCEGSRCAVGAQLDVALGGCDRVSGMQQLAGRFERQRVWGRLACRRHEREPWLFVRVERYVCGGADVRHASTGRPVHEGLQLGQRLPRRGKLPGRGVVGRTHLSEDVPVGSHVSRRIRVLVGGHGERVSARSARSGRVLGRIVVAQVEPAVSSRGERRFGRRLGAAGGSALDAGAIRRYEQQPVSPSWSA